MRKLLSLAADCRINDDLEDYLAAGEKLHQEILKAGIRGVQEAIDHTPNDAVARALKDGLENAMLLGLL